MEFQEYPKAIYKGSQVLIVNDKQEEDAAPDFGPWVNPFEPAAESQEAEEQPNSTEPLSVPADSAPAAPRRGRPPRQAA